MFAKAQMATDIVSQLCFDPATIAWWIGAVRARGVSLPIWIGAARLRGLREAASGSR